MSNLIVEIAEILEKHLPEGIPSKSWLGATAEITELVEVLPGPCFHDPGVTWPGDVHPRCELRAGNAGAHECSRGLMGGVAVWPADETPMGSVSDRG